ncbi:MAG: nicotinate-nucleotide--dimethylbenzimidazole phosphoribosyltransferase [Candidatus Binataceae bacterium]|jgi:nicotinate-nucleotide--dimethylbenzimidazole phosphoribosyltransferase
MGLLEETLAAIVPPDQSAADEAHRRLDALTKPRGSLGGLEEAVRRYAAIRHDPEARAGRCAITLFAADHGIAEEGVSAYPQAVTLEMVRNIASGGAAISVLARRFCFDLVITDVGVRTDTSATPFAKVTYDRVAAGTRNFRHGLAMSPEQAIRAIEAGIAALNRLADRGVTMAGIGEMGIANSTSAAAILSAATGIAPAAIVGRGTGLDDAGLRRKVEVVEMALALHRETLRDGGIPRLSAIGGFEIAAMAGVCLAAAARRVPIVVDGYIAAAAVAVAEWFYPGIREYLIFGHRGAEGGHAQVLEAWQVRPLLDLGMRLGEGTGAAIAMNLVNTALALYAEMATFASAGVSEKSG